MSNKPYPNDVPVIGNQGKAPCTFACQLLPNSAWGSAYPTPFNLLLTTPHHLWLHPKHLNEKGNLGNCLSHYCIIKNTVQSYKTGFIGQNNEPDKVFQNHDLSVAIRLVVPIRFCDRAIIKWMSE